jgi:hypothetical protein
VISLLIVSKEAQHMEVESELPATRVGEGAIGKGGHWSKGQGFS